MNKMREFSAVINILENHDNDERNLIAILQEVQKEYRYLPEEVMVFVATSLEIPPARVYGVASFYSNFTLQPKGKYVIKVCDGTACHVKGSTTIIDALKEELHLENEQITTSDRLFTVEAVSCLGACGLAPAMVINDDVYGLLTKDKVVDIITKLKRSEGA